MQNIICMKWGSRYDSDYVNRLYRSIIRHTKNKTKLTCFTDNASGINEQIDVKPLPEIVIPQSISKTPWRKISIWQYPLYNFIGDILFLDLDLVITGSLDKFFSYKKGEYCVIENWTQIGKKIGNTSCFRFPVKKYQYVFNEFEANGEKIWKKYHIEQVYLSKLINEQVFWPESWCKSFKHNLLPKWPIRIWKPAELNRNTSIVAFTGKPDPDDVLKGKWPVKSRHFYKKIYKQLRTPNWLIENWK